MDVKNKLVIETITAFVSVDKDGNEGVIAQMLGGAWTPFVCADPQRIDSILPLALELKKITGVPFKILQFSTREDITAKYI